MKKKSTPAARPPKLSQFKTLDDLIKFFAAIPAKQWTKFDYKAGEKFCALGHLGVRRMYSKREKIVEAKLESLGCDDALNVVNDGSGPPKKNVISYLRALRANAKAAARA